MKKLSKNLTMYVVYICMFIAVFCAMTLKAEAANVTSGTLGDNNGITWTYDADTKTLTVTGEDSGLQGKKNKYSSDTSLFADISPEVEVIILKNCTVKGSAESMFAMLKSVKRIEFDNFNTAHITDMSGMFLGCASLTDLDLRSFNTSNVTNMRSMFYECAGLTELDFRNFNTSKVTNMDNMFGDCSSLVSLDLCTFDTSNVTGMAFMFCGCESLVSVDVSSFDTSNAESMYSMFQDCRSLLRLDLSHFNTSKINNLSSMFQRCVSLEFLDISRFNTSKVQVMSYMFSGCSNLSSLDLSSFDLSRIITAEHVFNTYDNNTMLIMIKTPRYIPDGISMQLPTSYEDLNSHSTYSDTMYLTGEYCNTTLLKKYFRLEGFELEPNALNIPVGQGNQINAVVFPSYAPFEKITWSTSDRSIVTVDENGKIFAERPGTATITARLTDMKGESIEARCQVTVVLPVTRIVLSEDTLNLMNGKEHTLRAVVSPDSATIKDVEWTTSDKTVATVDTYGKVVAVGPGSATITATAADGSGVSASCEVTVIQKVTGISLEPNELHLNIGESKDLTLNITPINASNQEVSWSVAGSGMQVVTVSGNGMVTAKAAGTATITVRTTDGSNLSATCEVTVTDPVAEQERQVRAFVERMYTVALGRASESTGINYWTEELLSHRKDGAAISVGFIMSEEFVSKNYSNEDYLKVLYRTFFDREPDTGGMNFWLEQMKAGRSRKSVLAGFVNSKEFTEICESYGITRGTMEDDATATGAGQFVERLYTIAMERPSDPAGLEDWAQRINNKINTPEQVAKEFFLSPEYVGKNTSNDKYVETLYLVFMDRASEEGGKTFWVGQLNQGVSRESVLEGFAQSEEFKEIMERYGL